ncbi:MAG: GtrA family protein [Pseudomonadota bacterium]
MANDRAATLNQMVKFGVVGLTTNAIGYLLYLALTAFVLPPKLTMTLLYIVGTTLSYLGNHRFTFQQEGTKPRTIMAFCVVSFCGWALNYALLAFFSDHLGYAHQLVQAVAIFIVAGFLFVALKLFVFGPERPS